MCRGGDDPRYNHNPCETGECAGVEQTVAICIKPYPKPATGSWPSSPHQCLASVSEEDVLKMTFDELSNTTNTSWNGQINVFTIFCTYQY